MTRHASIINIKALQCILTLVFLGDPMTPLIPERRL